MITPEILSKLAPRTQEYGPSVEASPDVAWQDVLFALRGLDPGKTGFMLYIYGNDSTARHDFFAGLFMEVMGRAEVQAWIHRRRERGGYYRAVETMCLLAIIEWHEGKKTRFTDLIRAQFMGVSRSTWARKYKLIYRTIVSIPKYWQDEAMEIMNKRLR